VVLDAVPEKVIVASDDGATNDTLPKRVCPDGMSPRLQLHMFGTVEEIDSVTAVAASGPLLRTANESDDP
jgi:hypothetical protein